MKNLRLSVKLSGVDRYVHISGPIFVHEFIKDSHQNVLV